MILLDQLRETLGTLFNQGEPWLVAGLVALGGLSCWIFRLACSLRKVRLWVIRKGECPFCGQALFGTTEAYQRLCVLDVGTFENQYLCTACDKRKIAGLLSLLQDG